MNFVTAPVDFPKEQEKMDIERVLPLLNYRHTRGHTVYGDVLIQN